MYSGESSSPQSPTQRPPCLRSMMTCDAPHHSRIALGVTNRSKITSGAKSKVSSWMCLRVDIAYYLPSTTSIPESTRPIFDCDKVPACSVSRALSRLIICETLAIESFGSPVARGQHDVAWCFSPLQITREWNANDGRDSTAV